MTAIPDRPRPASRIRWVIALFSAVAMSVTPVAARRANPMHVPSRWTAYAATVTTALNAWLVSDAPDAVRVRQQLAAQAADGPSTTTVRLWVDRSGTVTRVLFDLPGTAADAPASFIGQKLGPPPRRMPQPLRLGIDASRQN